jgi:hypothetical protein
MADPKFIKDVYSHYNVKQPGEHERGHHEGAGSKDEI